MSCPRGRVRCSCCGRRAPGYDRGTKPRFWQALAFGTVFVHLRYAIRRVQCRRCGVRVEQVPWADPDRRFTRRFEEMVGYLAQVTDMTSTAKLMGISWQTVSSIVARLVKERSALPRIHATKAGRVDAHLEEVAGPARTSVSCRLVLCGRA